MTAQCKPLMKMKEEDACSLGACAGKRKRDMTDEDAGSLSPVTGKEKFMYVDVSLVQSAPPVTEPSDNESVATDDTECYDHVEPVTDSDMVTECYDHVEPITDSDTAVGTDCYDHVEPITDSDRSTGQITQEGIEGGRRGQSSPDSLRQATDTPTSYDACAAMASDFIIKIEPTWNSESNDEPVVNSEVNLDTEPDTGNPSVAVNPMCSPEKSIRNSLTEPTEPKTGLQLQGYKERKVCSVCNAGFNYISDLRRHMRIHTGERPFACHECDARFNRADHLKCHVLTHSDLKRDPKKFRCSQCGYVFTRKFDLKRHALRKHSVEDALPFVCCECDERFVTASEMNKHKRTHGGRQKPFVCEVCHSSFRLSSHLKAHATKHTGEKPLDMSSSAS